jgi:hypothetical protein
MARNETGSGRKGIHVFDLDDTLMRTAARIRVRDAGGRELRSLSPAEFTTYVLGPGERFDFGDFADVGILARGIVVKYTRSIIETLLRRGTRSDFAVLTARGDKNLHAPFLIRLFASLFGLRLRNSLIFNLSDARFLRHKEASELPGPFQGRRYAQLTIPERKALVLAQDLTARGYNDISLYDDSRENLQSFRVIRHAFPGVAYHPHFIDPTWRVRLEEFAASGAGRKTLIRGKESAALILEHHSRFRADPEAGLRALEAEGRVELDRPGLALSYAGAKYHLINAGAAKPLPP